ncbi:hypothetical protein GCK72_005415 [Caenorhabditis remanei]|uniref:Uncharacterized protein n=1 Tax=Caenorhabditis remanei TaxID=31234 RepID=A0A6A5HGI3_CAERE|nr:hypothetical protein GCK72_005415 [Caenorhabditis remanei]KAF1765463.1 hypothetical protein GCK72_005415 [Caenorhabditis remanei]
MTRRRSRSENYEESIAFHRGVQPITLIEQECTLVWRFPIDISQSSIGGRTTLSNACTLIAIKTAELIHIHDIEMPVPQSKNRASKRVMGGAEMRERTKTTVLSSQNLEVVDITKESETKSCPPRIVSCLINGIIDGNEAYRKDAGENSTRNYNLPDAINACDLSFSEVDFKLSTGSLQETLPKLIKLAVRNPLFRSERRLVFILISCVRTVLIVFDRSQHSLTLFDAHHHLYTDKRKTKKHGALIGTCRYSNLNSFAQWIQNFVFPDVKNTEEAFEISLIRITEVGTNKAQGVCKYIENVSTPLRTSIFEPEVSQENKENLKVFDYPVLRSILSKPPQIVAKIGAKRLLDSTNGKTSVASGRIKKQT